MKLGATLRWDLINLMVCTITAARNLKLIETAIEKRIETSQMMFLEGVSYWGYSLDSEI